MDEAPIYNIREIMDEAPIYNIREIMDEVPIHNIPGIMDVSRELWMRGNYRWEGQGAI